MFRKFFFRLPFRVVIAVPFALLIILAVGLTGYLAYRNGQQAVNHLADDLHRETIVRIGLLLDNYLSTPILINQINQDAIHLDIFNTRDIAINEPYLLAQLDQFETIVSVSYANEQGDFIAPVRDMMGAYRVIGISNEETDHALEAFSFTPEGYRAYYSTLPEYDPRSRPWYQAAVQAGRQVWTPIYLWTSGDIGIDAVVPVYGTNDQLVGVLSASLTLDAISDYLKGIKVTEHGGTFIVERSGLLVASSTDQDPVRGDGDGFQRLSVLEFDHPVIHASIAAVEREAGPLGLITDAVPFRFEAEGESFLARAVPYIDEYGLDWLVLTYIPVSDFMAPIEASNRQTALLILASIVGSILIAGLITFRVTQSIVSLRDSASSLAKGEWDQRVTVDRTDEIGDLANAFNHMAGQLHRFVRSIRTSEQRYQTLFEDSPVSLWELDGSTLIKHLDNLRETGIMDWPLFFEEHPDEVLACASMIKIIDVNLATMTLMGAETKNVFSDDLVPFFTPETLQTFNHLLVELGRGNPVFNANTVARNIKGERIFVHFSFSVLSGYEDTWARLLLSLDNITDRVKAEETLRESEALYRQAIEAAGAIPYRQTYSGLDYDANFEFVGEGIFPITGYSQEELNSNLWQSLIQEVHFLDDLDGYSMAEAVQKVRTGEIPIWKCEYLIRARDGTMRWIYDSAVELRGEDGVSYGSIGLLQDITDRKRAQEVLKESEQRFSILSTAAFEGIVISDKGQIIELNEQMAEMLGYESSEMIGMTVGKFVAPESLELVMQHIRSGSEEPYEHRAMRKDGSTFPVEIRAKSLPYKGSNVRVTAVRDDTQRKQSEAALRESERRFSTLAGATFEGIVITDVGHIIDVNEQMTQMLGYKRSEMIGSIVDNFIAPESMEGVAAFINSASEESLEIIAVRKDGTQFPAEIRNRTISYKDSIVRVTAVRDITERVQVEERMREMTRHLVAAQEEERKHIAQELHDELGQALTAISLDLGSIEHALPLDCPPDIKGRLTDARSLADEVDERISELALDLRPSLLDDLGLLPTLEWYINRFSQRLGIEVEVDFLGLEDRMPDEIEITIYRVIQEAITNVARHAQASRVRISLKRGPTELAGKINDDGKGFDVDKSEDGSRTPGSLGLFGIRDRISTLGGRVEIQSQAGRGVEIRFIIPL